MNKTIDTPTWMQYLEIPIKPSAPVKINVILAARMTAFMKARQTKPFKTCQ